MSATFYSNGILIYYQNVSVKLTVSNNHLNFHEKFWACHYNNVNFHEEVWEAAMSATFFSNGIFIYYQK